MIRSLQSLRFVFVLLIFLSHFAYRDIRALDAGGDCGVAFFFLLSGFVISMGYGPKLRDGSFRFGQFMKRRLCKVYPLHLLCLLFFLLVSGSVIDEKVLLNVLLLQSWVPCSEYYFSCNAVAWFLSTLMFCYMVFPLAWRYASGRGLLLVLAVYAVVCWLVPYDKVNAILYVHPLARFVDFYMGVVLFRWHEQYAARYAPPQWMEWALAALLLLLLAVYPWVDAKLRNAPMYWLVLVPLLLAFAQERGAVSRWLQTRPMMWLGSLAMPFFLIHQLLIVVLLHWLPRMSAPLMLATCLAVVLTVSWAIQIIFSRVFRY